MSRSVDIDWEKVQLEYVTGSESYKDMAKRLGISRATLSNRAIEGKWAEQRETYRAQLRTDVQKRMADLAADGMDTAIRATVKILRRLEARIDDEDQPITASDYRAFMAAISDGITILSSGGRGTERIEVIIGDAADYAG